MLEKMNKSKVLAVFQFDKCGIRNDMIKAQGKYIEIGIKNIEKKEVSIKKGEKVSRITLTPDFSPPLVVNVHKPYANMLGHTFLFSINPLVANYKKIASLYLLEAEDLNMFGDFSITFDQKVEGRKITETDWLYRVYCIN